MKIFGIKMSTTQEALILLSLLTILFQCAPKKTIFQHEEIVVRIAKLQIDSAHLQEYNTALIEGVEEAVRVEPGVLSLYAVAEKNNPTSITVFEIYASADAFASHLETPHFKRYKSITQKMVKSLELIETTPIVLEGK